MITVKLTIGAQKGTDCHEIKDVNFEPHKMCAECKNALIDGLCFNTVEELKNHVLMVLKSLWNYNEEINIEIV